MVLALHTLDCTDVQFNDSTGGGAVAKKCADCIDIKAD